MDRDLSYKLRLKRYMWTMGYFCPLEVSLSAYVIKYGKRKRYDLTDIDVLGIRFDNDLQHTIIIGDCKSGSESSSNRIFWLKGVMDFFSANRGYFVKPSITNSSRQLASRLNICLLAEKNLRLLEEEMGLKSLNLSIFDSSIYEKARNLWGIALKKGETPTKAQLEMKEIYQYFEYNFWIVDEYRNIQSIIEKMSGIPKYSFDYDIKKVKFLVYYGTIMLSLSLLKMGGFIISRDRNNFVTQAREYLFGGSLLLKERETLFKAVSEIAKEKLTLEPNYYNELLELVNRLIKFATYSKEIPAYLEIVLYEYILAETYRPLEEIFRSKYSIDSLKLSKDVAIFLCDVTEIDKRVFNELLNL